MKNRSLAKIFFLWAIIGCHFLAAAQSVDSFSQKNQVSPINLESVILSGKEQNKIRDSLKARISELQDKFKKAQRQGGVDSGGGNIVSLANGKLQLLDFFVHGIPENSKNTSGLPAIKLKNSKALNRWGIDRIDSHSSIYHETIYELIQNLEPISDSLSSILRQALFNLPIYIVNYDLARQDPNFYLPKEKQNSEIEQITTAALYFKDFGVFISKPLFDKLDFDNQIGLIIHESLRHLQITHGINLNDKDIQLLTVTLIELQFQSPPTGIPSIAIPPLDEKETDLAISKLGAPKVMDQIIMDYNIRGWTAHEEEQEIILQLLSESNIILLPEQNP